MFINKLFGKESKPKAQKDQDTKKSNEPDQSTTTEESLYDDYCDINYEALGWKGIYETRYRTLIPRRPIPEPPTKNEGKLITKHAIVNLPLQHVSSNRRIEDLDDDEYGYEASSVISRLKKKDTTWEEAFVDAHEFLPYQKDSHSFMISKFFFFPRENYEKLSIGEICRTMEEGSTEVQQDLSKYVTAFRLPNLKRNNRIAEIFNFLSCKEKSVKHLCINKLTEVIMDADQRKFTKEEMKNLYKTGTTELFTVISETKKTAPIFQSLIQLGIMFNCFIYLRAIEAVDDWIPCIQNVLSAIQSKKKRVMERNDLDVIIFAKMARCMFELEAVDFDESLLMGEDMDDFLPPFNREDNAICIEGLAALFHTGNLVLRQQSKFNPGVQKMVVLSSFMDGYTDEGMRKWYHRLLDLFIVHILQREHSDDLDFDGVPIRWAAPESLLKGFYSIYSDVWSVNILADEILNYAAWPYSDIIDSDIDDMVTNIVFTHLKPQGFNRPRRVQGLILEGLASEPDQRLKLEALRERLLDISHNVSRGKGYSTYDTYSGVEGTHAKVYDIPPLTERQIKPNSVFERGIPESIQRYRAHEEDSMAVFASKLAEDNERLREQDGIPLIEITSDEYYKIVHEDKLGMMKVMEKVSDDFLKFTYNRLKEIDSRRMCVEPWPPTTSVSEDGSKQLHYKFPRSTHLLDIALHKQRGDTIGPYIELLYELANHIDFFHSAGWIFRSLRAKHVWILETKIWLVLFIRGKHPSLPKYKECCFSLEHEQTIVVPKFGKYRVVASSDYDIHLEQIKVERLEETDGIQWLPIEAIKAGLYSKESDVYAFGMITWEIMSAFGQEGIVYDKDEERELTCIPFNYQQSANILQHLIKGYIPEKHVKCPDWFYQEVTRPCLLHQKIDRPSMKTILQILSTRLGKSLPKQILSLPPLPPPPTSTWSTNCPVRLPRQPSERYPLVRQQISEDVDSYEEVDSLTHLRTPPPLPPVLYHNTKERKNQDRVKRILPLPPKPKDVEENDTEEIPTLWIKGREAEENVAEDDVTFISPPIPRRPPPPAPTGNQIESTETTDEKSCKTLPLPKLPESSIKTLPLPKLPESSINLSENTSAPTLPPKPQCAIFIANQDSINIHKTSDYLEFPLNTRSQIWDNNKGSCNERKASLQSVEDTEGGSGNERKASLQSVKDTDRGSGNERKASLQSVEDTERGSDFDRTSGLCHAQQVDNSLGDTQRGSDFYGELTNIEKQSSPYVNETGTDTKPILPPRKPLNK
ncbi:uncharacterized protein LOC125670011 isoform X3 [Ostrea edulis]|uniref:uncharacterized protein LOC125670011 isoform X3 n=1 Tax=Ostrea edulis TaxID=37623 RepID=UPI0024AEC5B5|nr:uncharacterized protein LOC125670011 isoform X3 [Ostrea edulis]